MIELKLNTGHIILLCSFLVPPTGSMLTSLRNDQEFPDSIPYSAVGLSCSRDLFYGICGLGDYIFHYYFWMFYLALSSENAHALC